MSDIVVIRQGDALYPHRLLDLKNPPQQLYAKGNLQLLSKPMVAIVGTRDCTRYGISIAQELAAKCAAADICVVSGLAEGIDTAAHRGAGVNTIAVLGNGLDYYYPVTNQELQDDIANNGGLLISEYPLGVHGDKRTFPQRNRIVAALGQVVVAVEADKRSGTLITINLAKSMQREIFAVPGNINCYASQGTNLLIANHTAKMLANLDEVIKHFTAKQMAFTTLPTASAKPLISNEMVLSPEQQKIINILKTDEVHIDELIERSGLKIAQLSTLLTNMEMIGLIEKLPGNYFVAKGQ